MRASDIQLQLRRITFLFLLAPALLGCRQEVEEAPVTEEEPRVLVSLPPVTLNADGTPVAGEMELIEVPAAERLTLELIIDASDADSKPHQAAVIKILRTTRTGNKVTTDSRRMLANDEDKPKYRYQGDLEAPEEPDTYSIVVIFKGKEFCRHKLRVVASDGK